MKGLKLKYKKLYRKVAKDAKGIEIYRIGTDDSVKIPALWQNMVTSGGENIFPVEIEDALMDHPKIDDVACIGYPDERLVEIVLAIVQLKEGESMTEEELIEFAKSKMATYKVPRKVIFDTVMRNPTGKLMKPKLREKYTGRKEAFQKLD